MEGQVSGRLLKIAEYSKVFWQIVCFLGLFYQLVLVTQQYSMYSTTSEIEVRGRSQPDENLPALTYCIPLIAIMNGKYSFLHTTFRHIHPSSHLGSAHSHFVIFEKITFSAYAGVSRHDSGR